MLSQVLPAGVFEASGSGLDSVPSVLGCFEDDMGCRYTVVGSFGWCLGWFGTHLPVLAAGKAQNVQAARGTAAEAVPAGVGVQE